MGLNRKSFRRLLKCCIFKYSTFFILNMLLWSYKLGINWKLFVLKTGGNIDENKIEGV